LVCRVCKLLLRPYPPHLPLVIVSAGSLRDMGYSEGWVPLSLGKKGGMNRKLQVIGTGLALGQWDSVSGEYRPRVSRQTRVTNARHYTTLFNEHF
jgi:hypothetical protein